ncbi:glycosyltransferase [Candidatus Amoebophilus asiaticus]|nr:glycosyltransferase [Candidatus Amoebophilus asiaticus]
MKRIVFSVINDLNYDQRMNRICTSLVNGGYEVTLIGRKRSYSIPLKDREYQQIRFRCFFNKGKVFYVEYNLRLFFYLLAHNYDIYGGIDLDTIVPHYLVATIKNKPLVYDAHEFFSEVEEVANRPIVKAIWKKVEGWIVPRVNYAYTVNKSIANVFEESYNKQFHVIRNVSLLTDLVVEKKEEKYILYQGDVNIGRGLEETIEAMQSIDCKFYICGKGDIYEKLLTLPGKFGVESKVKFLGRFEPHQLLDITRKATIGITFFKNSGLNNYYSLANRFFDYIHAGVPQLTIRFPEYQRFYDEFEVGILVDLTPENIVLAANKMLSDLAFYNQLKENCLAARHVHNWQNEEKKLLEIYNGI